MNYQTRTENPFLRRIMTSYPDGTADLECGHSAAFDPMRAVYFADSSWIAADPSSETRVLLNLQAWIECPTCKAEIAALIKECIE